MNTSDQSAKTQSMQVDGTPQVATAAASSQPAKTQDPSSLVAAPKEGVAKARKKGTKRLALTEPEPGEVTNTNVLVGPKPNPSPDQLLDHPDKEVREGALRAHLRGLLVAHPNLSRSDIRNACRTMFPELQPVSRSSGGPPPKKAELPVARKEQPSTSNKVSRSPNEDRFRLEKKFVTGSPEYVDALRRARAEDREWRKSNPANRPHKGSGKNSPPDGKPSVSK